MRVPSIKVAICLFILRDGYGSKSADFRLDLVVYRPTCQVYGALLLSCYTGVLPIETRLLVVV